MIFMIFNPDQTLKGVTYNLHASGMKGKPPFVMSMATCLNSQPHPPGIGTCTRSGVVLMDH